LSCSKVPKGEASPEKSFDARQARRDKYRAWLDGKPLSSLL
jgi:hypothetical protein